jgi:hypothetical protein
VRRAVIVALSAIAASVAASGIGASSAPTPAWTLPEARAHLAAAGEFRTIDLTQVDEPSFWVRMEQVGRPSVKPVGMPVATRGVRRWRSFRFTGRVTDNLTGTRPLVRFDFVPSPRGGVRVRGFQGPRPDTSRPAFPIRGAFYYAWYPELWRLGDPAPYSHYEPSLGYYESGDASVLRRHVEAMRYGGIDVGIWSWWGYGDPTDARFPTALAVARPTPFRWAVYYEREGYGDPDPNSIQRDLVYVLGHYASKPSYLTIAGRPVVFVYSADDTDCSVVDRWREGSPGDFYVVLKAFPGYRDCAQQPDGWHEYGANPETGVLGLDGHATTIMPGFWLADRQASSLSRDLERWRAAAREMATRGDPFQLVVSFNEWGEGTAIESATAWASPSGQGAYLDVLHEELGASQAARARRSSTVDPRSVSRRSKSPAQSEERSGTASRLAAVARPSRARTSTASSR